MDYIENKKDMILFLYEKLDIYVKIAGSPEILSKALGYNRNYVRLTMERGKQTSMEKLWIKARDYYGV
jgi:hypothetical protein